MPVGFPVKDNYVTGDVLTAANMNDFAGTLNTVPNVVGGFAAGKNKIINGDFNIWQRGTSFTTAGGNNYSADRMIYNAALTPTVSRQSFTAGDISGYNPQFFLRFVKGNATADSLSVTQKIEDVRTFAGQTVTLSFWAKGSVAFTNSPLTRQMFGSGGSADVYTTYTSQSITTSWARYSMTFTVPSVVGKTIGAGSFVDMYFIRYTGSPDITVDVWGVQLEAGSIATPFQTATGTIQGELAACKRYLPSVTSYDNVIGYSYVTNNALYYFAFDVQARVAPTGVTATSASAFALNTPTTVTPTFQSAGVNGGSLNAAFTITAGQGSRIGGGSILFTGCEL